MTGDNIHHPVRNARRSDQLAKFQNGCRTAFGPFQHHRIASCQRRTNLHRGQKQLRIPWHNGGHHPQRLAVGENKHVGFVDRRGAPLDLVGRASIKVEILGNIFCLPARFLEHLASITRFDTPQILGRVSQQIAEPAQASAALCRGHASPFTADPRRLCGAHSTVNIF